LKSEGPFSAERDLYSEAAGADTGALPLKDRYILVVEDESLIAEHLAVILKDAGAEVIGPADGLPGAILLASETERIEAALLNIFLNGVTVFPLVDELQARAVPILFLTGYDDGDIPEAYSHIRRCDKPTSPARVVEELATLLRPVAA
jgi:DNA-binding response OmpR family regulator